MPAEEFQSRSDTTDRGNAKIAAPQRVAAAAAPELGAEPVDIDMVREEESRQRRLGAGAPQVVGSSHQSAGGAGTRVKIVEVAAVVVDNRIQEPTSSMERGAGEGSSWWCSKKGPRLVGCVQYRCVLARCFLRASRDQPRYLHYEVAWV